MCLARLFVLAAKAGSLEHVKVHDRQLRLGALPPFTGKRANIQVIRSLCSSYMTAFEAVRVADVQASGSKAGRRDPPATRRTAAHRKNIDPPYRYAL